MPALSDRSRVLVVDDEYVIAAALRRVLTEDGLGVEIAESGEAALDLLEIGAFEVGVIDVRLPGMTGLDLLALLQDRDPEMVVILMTGYASSEQAVEAFSNGAFTFLPKPFTFDEASNAVARAFRYRSLAATERVPTSGDGFDALLGMQSWGRVLSDGSRLVGVTDVFMRTIGPPTGIRMPSLDYPLAAGDVLARISGEDGRTYTAWAALGGEVLELNRALETAPGLIAQDPAGAGWIARLGGGE